MPDWVVTMRCVVIRELCCTNCTEEQARNDTFNCSVNEKETEVDFLDWEVLSVRPND